MKRLLLVILSVLSISSCTKCIDWIPVTFKILVQDEQGKDLLDPANDNSWLAGTELSFRGITVELDETGIGSPATKVLPAIYEGFRLLKGTDCYYLAFGEFAGGTDYDDEEICIYWGDGAFNRITYSRKINNLTVAAKETIKLDGVKCSNPIVIVK